MSQYKLLTDININMHARYKCRFYMVVFTTAHSNNVNFATCVMLYEFPSLTSPNFGFSATCHDHGIIYNKVYSRCSRKSIDFLPT